MVRNNNNMFNNLWLCDYVVVAGDIIDRNRPAKNLSFARSTWGRATDVERILTPKACANGVFNCVCVFL